MSCSGHHGVRHDMHDGGHGDKEANNQGEIECFLHDLIIT